MINIKFLRFYHLDRINLGDIFFTYNLNKNKEYKFIKVTRCGYNFLDLETNICLLKRHIYPLKNHGNDNTFYKPIYLHKLITNENTKRNC